MECLASQKVVSQLSAQKQLVLTPSVPTKDNLQCSSRKSSRTTSVDSIDGYDIDFGGIDFDALEEQAMQKKAKLTDKSRIIELPKGYIRLVVLQVTIEQDQICINVKCRIDNVQTLEVVCIV